MSTDDGPTEPQEIDRRPEVRIGDRDREQAVTHLGQAFAEGRLELHEYDERVASAYAAKTASDLLHLTADLPLAVPERKQARPRGATERHAPKAQRPVAGGGKEVAKSEPAWLRPAWQAWATVVTINLVIWFLVGLGNGADFPYFWPMWVAGPWGVILLLRTIAVKSRPSGR